ncbi:MAG: sigma-54-dependent Fis family transcriptional regulator [Hydrogenophilales bacterium]|nr:sigma-54-dependent Fis family transcriptional regulator [Hydrogenophilales bacterium]
MATKARTQVLVVEDDAALREALVDSLEIAGYAVHAATDAEAALVFLASQVPGLVLSDVQMPGMDGHDLLRAIKRRHPGLPVVLMTAYGQIDKAVAAMRDGAADYLPKPFEPDRLLATVARYFREPGRASDDQLVLDDPKSQALLDIVRRVAATDATVLLTGESGVGKEMFAKYLHSHSARRDGPFVAVNCAAIPENLVEATLFGHEKGAYTGAVGAQPGKFEQAQHGTLLLDEISEIPLNVQAKLLRALQERCIERVGGRAGIPLDIRVIAASNRDLATWVREGRFRDDLFYRLNVFPVDIPPLRQRKRDILPLARHFLQAHASLVGRAGFTFTEAASVELTHYDWPGNIRELSNVVQRAMILASGAVIDVAQLLLPARQGPAQQVSAPDADAGAASGQIRDMEKQMILDTLERLGGSRKRTADALGISERTLRYKLQRYRETEGREMDETDGDGHL